MKLAPMKGLGKHLNLVIGSYSPKVSCLEAPVNTIPHVFSHLQDLVPVFQKRETFGHAPLAEGVTVQLPKQFQGM